MPDADASNPDDLDERLRAVERALTDSEADLTDLRDAAELTRELESLSTRLEDVADRVAELDAATQALRGYVGSVRAVNETVERRADTALAKVETLETEVRESSHADRATSDTHATTPCRCQFRRHDPDSTEPECDETAGDDRGAVARIVSALTGVL